MRIKTYINWDIVLIQYQILESDIQRNVWKKLMRVTILNLVTGDDSMETNTTQGWQIGLGGPG